MKRRIYSSEIVIQFLSTLNNPLYIDNIYIASSLFTAFSSGYASGGVTPVMSRDSWLTRPWPKCSTSAQLSRSQVHAQSQFGIKLVITEQFYFGRNLSFV